MIDIESGTFSGQLTLPDIDIPDYQLFSFVPTTVKAKVIPEGPVTGTISEDGALIAQSTVGLQIDELSVFGLPLLTPGSVCKTVEPTTVDLIGADFDPETGGTLTGSYTAANFSGCGLLGFFIEPILNGNVSGIENAISVDFTAPLLDEGQPQ